VVFYTTGSPESVRETFMDTSNTSREKPVHKNFMAKVLEDTNQGIPAQGDSCAFLFFGNVGVPLMTTLNLPRLNVGLPVGCGPLRMSRMLLMLLR
jgi:hypothetical protein